MKIITFLTDFGSKSSYPAQMKGVISSITNARYIDITHDITPHNIYEGAFILRTSVPYFPIGTVNLAVVDPGVGTDRKGLVITTKTQILIGPDNGLLLPTANYLGDFIVYEISNKKYQLNSISNTFHGRDIFAPITAHIINGIPFEEIGRQIDDYVNLDFGYPKINNQKATGKIIYIDTFGNIITNIEGTQLKKIIDYDNKITVNIKNKKRQLPFIKSYNFVKKRQYLATIGSSNLIEISINQGNAAKHLGVKIGDEIIISFD
jgi:hypothetical protein